MANSLCFLASPPTSCIHSPIKSHIPTNLFSLTSDQNSLLTQKRQVFQTCKSKSFQIQATDGTQTTKSNSILCPNCEGKVLCEIRCCGMFSMQRRRCEFD
ncbi:Protein BUNDLE SHEATH DEFECTIVE 2 [Hirschfeldia incana]|nr:Protein BUNDLE SHEATH DEFECTIVE 2 [Hirschfeldia incana]